MAVTEAGAPSTTSIEQVFVGAGFPADSDPADFYFDRMEHSVITCDADGAHVSENETTVTTFPIPRQFMIGEQPYFLDTRAAAVSDRATVTGSLLGSRVLVHAGAQLSDASIAHGVEIPAKTTIRASSIANGVTIGDHVVITNSTIGSSTRIGRNSGIDAACIGANVCLEQNIKIIDSRVDSLTNVGTGTRIENATIAHNVSIGTDNIVRGVTIDSHVETGKNATIKANLGYHATVLSNTTVERVVPDNGVAVNLEVQHVIQQTKTTNLTHWLVRLASK